ncbi:unnamed protein product [Ilex paraguariensis]|uniref:Receptor-like serine/threonine-protein kinase n=1 Tax=Ilex paraguariensis TaxID=185542 RepID=A0ABC8V031_9AQUA
MNLVEKILIFSVLFLLKRRSCTSIDTINSIQSFKDGDNLVSKGGSFKLGFFSPGSSSNRYVGIWYNKVKEQTVVWVANRNKPITSRTGVLSINKIGNLVLYDENRDVLVWTTNVLATTGTTNESFAQLLETGNLVLFQGNKRRVVVWQSFDYPTNTMLPYMKFGVNHRTGLNRFLTSWKSREDPGIGEYSLKMDPNGAPQLFLFNGSVKVWRTGPWIGQGWNGVPEMKYELIVNASYVDNYDETYRMDTTVNASILSRYVMNESGVVEKLGLVEEDQKWVVYWHAPKSKCDNYDKCGVNSYCDPYSFECTCLPGSEPNSTGDWYSRDGSKGCTRKRGEQVCRNDDRFTMVERAKVPDTSLAQVNKSMGTEACMELCLRNCSCTGYASADVNGTGKGCITWYEDLIDTTTLLYGGQDLYIRVNAAGLAQFSKKSKWFDHKRLATIVGVSLAAMLLMLSLVYWLATKKKKGMGERNKSPNSFVTSPFYEGPSSKKEIVESGPNSDIQFFDLSTIVAATDNFSLANRLGEGGFGAVYKGRLPNGQEVAVKRLSKNSRQGIEELKNEVKLIARLQHRNLVRLLGCCIQEEEKMLIYEYLPNKGLDSFIFDKAKKSMLDWKKRYEIILGITRGMLYLHEDSRLKIIHRDLKASNVLLDATMNPKISDFGMAKIFDGDQIEANTNRVVGTYGYMSPEYAMKGLFSIKSDVFSFGVMLLEIISARKNNSYSPEDSLNLIEHVWDLWKESRALEIVDLSLGESYQPHEVLRCIHIGLLCVQEFAADRPSMSEIAFMLSHDTTLPSPNQSAFIFRRENNDPVASPTRVGPSSINDVTLSAIEAR